MVKSEELSSAESMPHRLESVESVTDQMGSISLSTASVVVSPSANLKEAPKPEASEPDIDKRIRALKKKVIFSCLVHAIHFDDLCLDSILQDAWQCLAYGEDFFKFNFFLKSELKFVELD